MPNPLDAEGRRSLLDIIGPEPPQRFIGGVRYDAVRVQKGMDPKTGWKAHFAYEWSEQAMFLDFSKSIHPPETKARRPRG